MTIFLSNYRTIFLSNYSIQHLSKWSNFLNSCSSMYELQRLIKGQHGKIHVDNSSIANLENLKYQIKNKKKRFPMKPVWSSNWLKLLDVFSGTCELTNDPSIKGKDALYYKFIITVQLSTSIPMKKHWLISMWFSGPLFPFQQICYQISQAGFKFKGRYENWNTSVAHNCLRREELSGHSSMHLTGVKRVNIDIGFCFLFLF